MKNQVQHCKYCSNYRVAVYGPMNSGYCINDPFKIIFNENLGVYERKVMDRMRDNDPDYDGNSPCSSYRPIMPTPTQEWFQKIFKK